MKKIVVILSIFVLTTSSAFAYQQGNVSKHIFFKGLNTKAGPVSLDDGESPDCMNVHTNIFGTLVKRNGYEKQNSAHNHVTTSPGKVNGLYDFAVDSTTSKLVGLFDNLIYKMDDLDGSFDRVHSVSNPSDSIAFFENFDGNLIMTSISRDYAQYWTGVATTSAQHVQITPKGKYQIKAYNRWFLSDCDDGTGTIYPLRFYYTEAGTFQTIASYEELDANAGDVAMGWGLLKGRLVGFTKYTVNIVTDVGGNDPIFVDRRVDGTGCGAARTIATINHPKFGESLVWLTQDKRLVLWNGSNLIDIGEKIQINNSQCPFYLNLINTSNLYKSHANVDAKNGQYILYVPISADVDYGLIYDYKTDTIWPISNQNFDASTVVATSSGNYIYTGDRVGGVYKWDSGNTDGGSAINAYWTSRKWDFDFMPQLKKFGETQVTTKTIGNYNLGFQYRFDYDTAWSSSVDMSMFAGGWLLGDILPATLGGSQAQVHQMAIPRAFNLYQIKFTANDSNPAFEVYGLDLFTNKLSIGEGD